MSCCGRTFGAGAAPDFAAVRLAVGLSNRCTVPLGTGPVAGSGTPGGVVGAGTDDIADCSTNYSSGKLNVHDRGCDEMRC